MKPLYDWIALVNDDTSNQSIPDLQSVVKKLTKTKSVLVKKKVMNKTALVGRKKAIQYKPTEQQTPKVIKFQYQ
jgi:hypothetical protein